MKSFIRMTLTAATAALFVACSGGESRPDSGGGSIVLGFSQIGAESEWRTANTASIQSAAPEAGITPQQIAALDGSANSSLFQPAHRALLAYTDAMTVKINVSDEVFDKLRLHYSDQQIVELTVLIGAYNMHTRVGRALQIDPEAS